jgi:hypothetical protein
VDQLLANVGNHASFRHIRDAPREIRPGDALQPPDKREILADFHVRVQRRTFRQIADPLFHFQRLLQHIESGHVCRSGGRRQKAGQDPHRRRLPRAIRTEESDNLAFLNFKGNIVDSDVTRVSLRQAFHLDHS